MALVGRIVISVFAEVGRLLDGDAFRQVFIRDVAHRARLALPEIVVEQFVLALEHLDSVNHAI